MEPTPSKFPGFPEPKSNFTPVPNLFFDKVLSDLKEGELKALLYIFRRTYGWQKEADCIVLTQFEDGIVTKQGKRLDYGTGLSRSTINEALKSLKNKGYILRYIPGKGSQRRNYVFLNTETNRQIVQALKCGQLTIEQALGSNSEPRLGRNFKPSQNGTFGRNSEPTRQRSKKREQKKGNPPINQNLPNTTADGDDAERLREQRLSQRRIEGSTSQPAHIGKIFQEMNLPGLQKR